MSLKSLNRSSSLGAAIWGISMALSSAVIACAGTTGSGGPPTVNDARQGPAIWYRPPGGCPSGIHDNGDTCVVCSLGKRSECKAKCEAGDGNSCALLAVSEWLGADGPVDEVGSRTHFERGCLLGSLEGCEGVARAHEKGLGGPKNEQAAYTLFEEVCSKGKATSCTAAARMQFNHFNKPVEGLALTERACALGHREGCRLLSQRCAAGPTPKEGCARSALDRACALGDEASCAGVRIPSEVNP